MGDILGETEVSIMASSNLKVLKTFLIKSIQMETSRIISTNTMIEF